MKITFYSAKPYEIKHLEQANEKVHTLNFVKERLILSTVQLAQNSEAVSVFTNDEVSAEVLEKLNSIGVKYIATRSAGYDHIDIVKAEELGMAVANVPDYSPYSIAEHAIAMIMCLNRKLVQADQKVKRQNFLLDDLIGFDLKGKTVGVVGTGKIGGIVCKILHGFDCNILAYDLWENPSYVEDYQVKYVDLPTLYAQSDIISFHCPLNRNTRHMVDDNAIAGMKEGVMIINTGRGGVIDTEALIKGLKAGKIGYAGLDVYENEKGLFFQDHEQHILQDDIFARLLTLKNVLITGHQAFLTKEALTNIADTTVYNIDAFEKGVRGKNELTKGIMVS